MDYFIITTYTVDYINTSLMFDTDNRTYHFQADDSKEMDA